MSNLDLHHRQTLYTIMDVVSSYLNVPQESFSYGRARKTVASARETFVFLARSDRYENEEIKAFLDGLAPAEEGTSVNVSTVFNAACRAYKPDSPENTFRAQVVWLATRLDIRLSEPDSAP